MNRPAAIITGAGRGIGRAAAIELVRRGYEIVLAARSLDELEETRRLAGNGTIVPTDVTIPQDLQRLVNQALGAYGSVTAVINNAGLAPLLSIEETTPELWRQIIDTNLSSSFFLSRVVWPHFKKQRKGVIVNVSSIASRDPFPGFAAYGAAKAGVNLLTLALAREGSEFGVRAHAVAPGAVETKMFRELMTHEQWPTEKTLDPGEVARVIADMVTREGSYASGEVVFISK